MYLLKSVKGVTKEISFVMYSLGMGIMSFLFFSFFTGMMKLIAGFSIGKEDICVSLFLCAVVLFILGKKNMTSTTLRIGLPLFVMLLLILLLFLCISCEGNYFTMDWDSNTYHKSAVGFFKNGWNPLRESAEDFSIRYFSDENVCASAIWIDHYPKATWIMGGKYMIGPEILNPEKHISC